MKNLYRSTIVLLALSCLSFRGYAQVNLPTTLTFTSDDPANWSDGIAQDGDGGSSNINGLDIQIYATDASFNLLPGHTIVWQDNTYLNSGTPGFNGITSGPDPDVTNNGIPAMVIKSSSTSVNFALQSMQLYDWGGTSPITVAAYDNGTLLGSVDVNFDQVTWQISTVNFDPATFGSIDEMRFYPAPSSGMPAMWLSMNNIALATATTTVPVTFASFSAIRNGDNGVDLNWQTAAEQDADRFEVERSFTGNSFEKIGEIKAHGSTSSATSYQFRYDGQLSGKIFFRLKEVDKDGSFSFSKTVSVAAPQGQPLRLAPNPARYVVTVTSSELISELHLYATSGACIRTVQVNGFAARLDLDGLPRGIYFLSAQHSHSTERNLLVKN